MPYINLDLDYFTNIKVIRLVGLLGTDAVTIPIKLWVYVAKHHCEKGLLAGYSADEVESIVGWAGEKGKCIDALLKIRLLDSTQHGYAVHDWLEHAGHLAAFKKRAKSAAKKRWKKYATSTAKSKTTNTPTYPNHPNLSEPILTVPTKPSSKDCAMPSAAALTWERYANAYLARYKTPPVRNAKVNGQITQLVKRIGEQAAPEVAAFYVWLNDFFYIKSGHPIGLLLHNAETLHTQWKTGQTITQSQARKIDETQGRVNVFQELINERKETCHVKAS